MKRINEVSRLAGVTKRTLQYYDDEGLLHVKRAEDNSRIYDEEDLERLWEIMLYKEMGFKLNRIKQIFQMSDVEREKAIDERISEILECKSELELQVKFAKVIKKYGIPSYEKQISYRKCINIIQGILSSMDKNNIKNIEIGTIQDCWLEK